MKKNLRKNYKNALQTLQLFRKSGLDNMSPKEIFTENLHNNDLEAATSLNGLFAESSSESESDEE